MEEDVKELLKYIDDSKKALDTVPGLMHTGYPLPEACAELAKMYLDLKERLEELHYLDR
jgi:hypothetical protein